MTNEDNPQSKQPPSPDPALRRLDPLVGKWRMTGRTLKATEDNLIGEVTIEWLPGGYFMQQRGEMTFMGQKIYSLEIIGYDPKTKAFSATVFSNMDGAPARYYWDVQGNVVTHWMDTSKYTGTLSEDGKVLDGGWRPNPGQPDEDHSTYDATMTKID